jgi:hypothetical protein
MNRHRGLFGGILFITVGVLQLLGFHMRQYWPVALIMMGIQFLIAWRGSVRIAGGMFWLSTGILFLLANVGYVRVNVLNLVWPVLLIWFGLFTFLGLPRCNGGRS